MIQALVASLAAGLPFGYAFAAGMVTMVSPCCIAMLPAYVSLHLGQQQEGFQQRSALRRLGKALVMGGAVTLAFVFFFGLMGLLLTLGGHRVMAVVPWLAVAIGAGLVVMGIFLLAGKTVYTSLPARLAARVGGKEGAGLKAYLAFGVTYAIAALSCTIPIFLVVVGTAIALKGLANGLLQFVSYALGMGVVITLVTVASALFREAVTRWVRRLAPLVGRISGGLLVLAGGYILYYWIKLGDILGLGL